MSKAWPRAIAVGLIIVVLVNLAMAWYAVTHPPEIVPSYDAVVR